MKFTVLGSTGFIGSALVRHLRSQAIDVDMPPRETQSLRDKDLGHVVYAIGLTGNFRQRPDAAIEAHVNVLRRLIDGASFESWLYLSSTRVYSNLPPDRPAGEESFLSVQPGADGLYDLSKLLGEAICLSQAKNTVRVARLSNVYGAGQSEHTFLGSIVRDLKRDGKVTIGQSPDSSKDYVAVEDVAECLAQIATNGRERIYNVSSGQLVTHGELATIIRNSGYGIDFTADAPTRVFPPADPSKIQRDFGKNFRSIINDLPRMLEDYKNSGQRINA